jgi:molybdopterin converting factor small subunit
MPTVKIPTPLRKYTEKQRAVVVSGSTVGEALDELIRLYPGLSDTVFDGDALHRTLTIFVGEEEVRILGGLDAVVNDETILRILVPISGG